MKIYLKNNVFEEALYRMRWLFDEFPNVIVDISGGKDSTVIYNLAMQVAIEKNRLPLRVAFFDLEAHWETVIDHVKHIFSNPNVMPMWFQIPLPEAIINAITLKERFFHCWDESRKDVWMRDKEDIAIKENIFGVTRYDKMFSAVNKHYFPNQPVVHIAGVRTEESPSRSMGLTMYETYKGATWGKKDNAGCFTFYPIYDWSFTDVWKAINDNKWEYCKIYDIQYQYGIPINQMRVSSVVHESSIYNTFYMHEFEPKTWGKLVERVGGVNTLSNMKRDAFIPNTLPYMFANWKEYRDYLLENLIDSEESRERLARQFKNYDALFLPEAERDLTRTQINIILTKEIDGIKLSMFSASHQHLLKNRGARGSNWHGDREVISGL